MKNTEAKFQSQSDKFKAMAKEVEADGDEKAFDRLLQVVTAAKKKTARKG